ncbi:DUF1508 domain-containing protein [Pseudarthrobacter sp. NIBRBAC000502772]|uniref:DUF1508 domain-containing protein n=1 Tax=Pseudarthrobacter sp. NIBRBAC000502772 TaxID=2590775 RepID=UPI001FF027DC|nr:DUF1508 domain-containing protein [Pseudarthrobacter sp. NIBRBAC000502772]
MAVSGAFENKAAVVAGIAAVRECAGTGLVTDLCPAAKVSPTAPAPRPWWSPPNSSRTAGTNASPPPGRTLLS